jgi:small-conductance mechanosensitive channel
MTLLLSRLKSPSKTMCFNGPAAATVAIQACLKQSCLKASRALEEPPGTLCPGALPLMVCRFPMTIVVLPMTTRTSERIVVVVGVVVVVGQVVVNVVVVAVSMNACPTVLYCAALCCAILCCNLLCLTTTLMWRPIDPSAPPSSSAVLLLLLSPAATVLTVLYWFSSWSSSLILHHHHHRHCAVLCCAVLYCTAHKHTSSSPSLSSSPSSL